MPDRHRPQKTPPGSAPASAGAAQAKANVLTELENKLRQRLPSYAEFEASFLELRSSRVYTQQTPLVRYVLRRLHVAACAEGANPEELDFDALTIEHLVPQGIKRPSTIPQADVARLGNLLLVTNDLNEALDDKPFATKQQILRADRANVDDEIVNASQWGSTGDDDDDEAPEIWITPPSWEATDQPIAWPTGSPTLQPAL